MNQIEAMLKIELNRDKTLNTSLTKINTSNININNNNNTRKNSQKITENLTMKKTNSNHRIYYNNNNNNSNNFDTNSYTKHNQQTPNEIATGQLQSRLILNGANELPKRDYTSQDFDLKFKNKFLATSNNNNNKTNINKQKTLSFIKTPVIERANSERDYNNLKRIQRNQIYALNELMTRLEHENFIDFCEAHNIEPRC